MQTLKALAESAYRITEATMLTLMILAIPASTYVSLFGRV